MSILCLDEGLAADFDSCSSDSEADISPSISSRKTLSKKLHKTLSKKTLSHMSNPFHSKDQFGLSPTSHTSKHSPISKHKQGVPTVIDVVPAASTVASSVRSTQVPSSRESNQEGVFNEQDQAAPFNQPFVNDVENVSAVSSASTARRSLEACDDVWSSLKRKSDCEMGGSEVSKRVKRGEGGEMDCVADPMAFFNSSARSPAFSNCSISPSDSASQTGEDQEPPTATLAQIGSSLGFAPHAVSDHAHTGHHGAHGQAYGHHGGHHGAAYGHHVQGAYPPGALHPGFSSLPHRDSRVSSERVSTHSVPHSQHSVSHRHSAHSHSAHMPLPFNTGAPMFPFNTAPMFPHAAPPASYQWVETFDPSTGAICGQWVPNSPSTPMVPPPLAPPGLVMNSAPHGASGMGGHGAGNDTPSSNAAWSDATWNLGSSPSVAAAAAASRANNHGGNHGAANGKGGNNGNESKVSILVSNLGLHSSPAILKTWFEEEMPKLRPKSVRDPRFLERDEFCIVKDSYVPLHHESGFPKGFAFVEFYDPDDCSAAVAFLNGATLQDHQLSIQFAKARRKTADDMVKRTPGKDGNGGKGKGNGNSGHGNGGHGNAGKGNANGHGGNKGIAKGNGGNANLAKGAASSRGVSSSSEGGASWGGMMGMGNFAAYPQGLMLCGPQWGVGYGGGAMGKTGF